MIKFHIIILGCQMNYADSARIKAVLTNCGFLYTENIEESDIIIFDTCSVRQKSEDKITGQLKEINPNKKIWITGCMIQHNLRNQKITSKELPENLKRGNFLGYLQTKNPEIIGITADEINTLNKNQLTHETIGINHAFNPLFYTLKKKQENIELFRRIDDTGFLPLILQKLGYQIQHDQEVTNEYSKIIPEGFNTSMNNHKKTAYIPISSGCNQFCSYCIVPYARGLEKHYPKEQIIEEAKRHLVSGCKEIVLLGQIVNKHPDFVDIVKDVLKLEGLERLRYTSPYPNFYTPELLKLHETESKLCPHIHIPFQSGSNTVLKAMRRGYTSEQAKEFIDNIRNLKRDISITTDIIVGYPDETEKDFQETLDLVKYGKFDMIYIGIYSPRPGTYAHKNHPDNIDRKTKRARRDNLNEILKKTSQENNQKEIGQIRKIIVDKKDENNMYGYTDNMKQIIIINKSDFKINVGDFVNVRIIKAIPFKLYGEIVEN
ncbi:MAG: MiaB/RimO family radical SAM methylthiotransferase [Candidatus Absconditabacteria bacterium]|nr:MiaB/RimO family radical SAM methylthiotransferase [Candidatus Absconditabacteria bacterium]